LVVVALAGAYVGSAILQRWIGLHHPLVGALLAAASLAPIYLGLLVKPSLGFSRTLLIQGSILVLVGTCSWAFRSRLSPTRFWPLGILVVVAAVGAAVYALRTDALIRQPARQIVQASQHILSVESYAGYLPKRAPVTGGAIVRAPDGEGYALVTARGHFYRFYWDEADALQLVALHLRAPINGGEFDADAENDGWKTNFRVADLVVQRKQDETKIFVSHHYWKRERKCFVVRVSSHAWPPAKEPLNNWRTVYESSPCLPIEQHRGAAFAGEQIGGNLEFLDARHLLVTMGDHQFDGWYKPTNYVQDLSADYGKTLLIDTETGKASIFTVGHRNPQGLAIDGHGRIWGTDHGPMGGDELNLLEKGGNYGYPFHTYGTDYGGVTWPPGEKPGVDKREFVLPAYSWVPSIGISEVVSVADPAFERWRGDLLVASLRGRAIWRVRPEQDRVAYAEPIVLGERLRDIAAGAGEFVVWTDSDAILRIRPVANLNDGATAFILRCGNCHRATEHRIGPSLRGIVGRSVASAKNYRYSEAMKRLTGKWTEVRLQDFLADPRSYVPGTTMSIDGIPDIETRRQIVRYLKDLH
jgi:cytochrome c2